METDGDIGDVILIYHFALRSDYAFTTHLHPATTAVCPS